MQIQSSHFVKRVSVGMAVLAAGAILEALSRFGVRANMAIVVSALLFGAGLTRGSPTFMSVFTKPTYVGSRERRARTSRPLILASVMSVILLCAEITRLLRRGSQSGFPIWLSDLFHEDNSRWISLGVARHRGEGFTTSSIGFAGALMQSVSNGASTALALVLDLPLDAVGIAVVGVGVSYIFVVVICPILAASVAHLIWIRTGSEAAAFSAQISLTVLLGWFMREARELGHLSAAFVVLSLSYSFLVLSLEASQESAARAEVKGMWALALSCLLWFPLKPLALIFGLWAFFERSKGGGIGLIRGRRLKFIPTSDLILLALIIVCVFPMISDYTGSEGRSSVRMLLNQPGGTYRLSDFFLLLLAIVVGSVVVYAKVGTMRERATIGLMAAYAISARFADQLSSAEFEYGSTKLFWIFTPVLIFSCVILLARDAMISDRVRQISVASFVVLSLFFANSESFYGTVRSIGPLVWSDVGESLVELDNPAQMDDLSQWDEAGGLDLRSTPFSLPIACVMVLEGQRPIPQWGFEPYRCTRKMGEMSIEVFSDSPENLKRLEGIWRGYPLMDIPLISAIVDSAYSRSDLSREILLLDRDGVIIRSERALDFLSQVALSDPVQVETVEDFFGPVVNSIPFNVDSLDLHSGTLSLWAGNELERIVLVADRHSPPFVVDREPREDVAKLLGRSNIFSGLTLAHESLSEEVRCIFLTDRDGKGTLAWSRSGTCSL